jgi:1-acyl-sn-glycerol-3-phosphate acyltransferase
LGAVLFVQGEVDFNTLRPNARWQACIDQFDRWSWPIFSYFPISVFNDGNKDPNKETNKDQPKYIFCYHPHGIYALGLFSLVFQRASGFQQQFSPQRPREGMLVAVASALLHVPLLGRLFSWFGFIPASRASLNAACETRNDLVIVPGGIAEMTLIQQTGIELVYLSKRKGFIKLAVKHGRPLVPVYCFGETKIFHQYRFFENTRLWLSRKLKISIVFFRGRNCTLVPRQVPLNVVVGEPIHVAQSDAPSDTYIDQIHGQYVDRLTELFDKYKSQHPEYQNSRLKIV